MQKQVNQQNLTELRESLAEYGGRSDHAGQLILQQIREAIVVKEGASPALRVKGSAVNPQLVINALDSADIGYWLGKLIEGAQNEDVMAGTDHAMLTTDDEPAKVLTLDRAAVLAGIEVMAARFPRHFANLITDNSDAETGDVLIQCALFGDIIYG